MSSIRGDKIFHPPMTFALIPSAQFLSALKVTPRTLANQDLAVGQEDLRLWEID
jgi:hypothetical protein